MSNKNILIVNKKRLRQVFSSDDLPLTPYLFRKLFFTDDFIQNILELSLSDFNGIKNFSPKQTEIIMQHFKIKEEDLV
ncbi:MAG: hypothetical protein RLZZ628_3147 [Bacteroidota bacterium]|jgi:hypothetical protein